MYSTATGLMGTSMAGFARTAAKEKAQILLDRESRLTLSAIQGAFQPNPALQSALEARKQVTAFALLVDAKDSAAKVFYIHYGFTACQGSPMTLYLPLG